MNALEQLVVTGETMETADTSHVQEELRSAAKAAADLPEAALNRAHPELAARFKRNFRPGLVQLMVGLEKRDAELIQRGGEDCDRFVLWLKDAAAVIEANSRQ